ncbi:MAG: hypothetical protein AABY22_09520, partial [Nanoarchaeota archaeon]
MPAILDLSKEEKQISTLRLSEEERIPTLRLSEETKPTLVLSEEKQPITQGLFGTRFGEKSSLLALARKPAELSRKGLRQISDLIPEPEKKSVVLNVLLNIPKTTAEIGSEFAAGIIEPETPIVGMAGKAILPFLKTPFVKKAIQKISENIPSAIKRAFSYRFGQPEAFKEAAEQRIASISKGGERAKEIGQELVKGLSKTEQLRLGQIVKGGISISERELPLRQIAQKARDELSRLGSESVEEGLLNEKTNLKNVKTYMPRLYRKYEQTIEEGKGKLFSELFGTKPQRIIGKRFLKKGDIPEELRIKLGEIKEPSFPVARGIAQLTHDVETAKLFRTVSENPEWSSDIAKEGFIQLTGTAKKLGKLSNKYVHPEIARDINELINTPSNAEKIYNDLLSKWKFGKVVLNPATHARNFMSNSILLD